MTWTILFLILGLSTVVNSNHASDIGDDIYDIEKKKETIDGLFSPVGAYDIGRGGYGTIFRGLNLLDDRLVAMKFTSNSEKQKKSADQEYEMYTYLDAIDNPEVEKYGISPIFYYNKWNKHILTVFALFEEHLLKKSKEIAAEPINSLILFRDFVGQSKYMHAHGVRHDDIKPENIMLRKHRSFLIDFNHSAKMNDSNMAGTYAFLPRRFYKDSRMRVPLDDWESFLYSMCQLNKIDLPWFDQKQYVGSDKTKALKRIGELKDEVKKTIKVIKEKVKPGPLQDVFVAFANQSFMEDTFFPNYDEMDTVIQNNIEKLIGKKKPALFTWLTDEDRAEAIKDLNLNPRVNTKDIPQPSRSITYKKVDYGYFDQIKNKVAEMRKADAKSKGKKRLFETFKNKLNLKYGKK